MSCRPTTRLGRLDPFSRHRLSLRRNINVPHLLQQQPPMDGTPLSSLAAWSAQHIRDVFEAPTDAQSQRALTVTFSRELVASLNGAPLDFAGLCALVGAMRASAPRGLTVKWTHAEETPDDPANRGGSLVGEYIIHGIWKNAPDPDSAQQVMSEFERHKKVDVRIESSQGSDSGVDSRVIVRLAIVASDISVDRRTS
ncbi:hypothetical protein DFH09DRAFT_1150083 [Mycena vulgaris]|nr:hypothetical protein DFH09DRAFT_1231885 [Mycena vulgaris]KAJ6576722.1 hypothetical protein DFH09DRAFT_1150083 [Mycena vulgaris]